MMQWTFYSNCVQVCTRNKLFKVQLLGSKDIYIWNLALNCQITFWKIMPIYPPIQYTSGIDCYCTSLKVRIPISLKFGFAFICNEWDRRYFHISKRHFFFFFYEVWFYAPVPCPLSILILFSLLFIHSSLFPKCYFLYHKYFIKSISFVLFCS